jgi:hypothetical protein
MDEVIWVEVLSRHRGVQSRHRFEGACVRIGRAYSNDVILDDPYVAPEHAQILRDDDGRLFVEDLGSANGLFAAHGGRRLDRLALGDDGLFRIGHATIRVRRASHGVAPERVFGRQTHAWAAVGALGAVALAIGAGTVWLDDYVEFRATTYLLPLLSGAILLVVWAALWAMAARIFAGQSRFEQNLIIALAGALGLEAVGIASKIGAFGLSWSALANNTFIGYLTVLALTSLAHLRDISPARTVAAGCVVAVLLGGAVAVEALVQSDARSGPATGYVQIMLPPSLRLAPVANESSFFSSVEKLRSQLDRDRAGEP